VLALALLDGNPESTNAKKPRSGALTQAPELEALGLQYNWPLPANPEISVKLLSLMVSSEYWHRSPPKKERRIPPLKLPFAFAERDITGGVSETPAVGPEPRQAYGPLNVEEKAGELWANMRTAAIASKVSFRICFEPP